MSFIFVFDCLILSLLIGILSPAEYFFEGTFNRGNGTGNFVGDAGL